MLRIFFNNLRNNFLKTSIRPTLQSRYLDDKIDITIGGGLEKPQGGLKEENYFYKQNNDLMAKIQKQGTKLKCENHISDCNQIEKVLEPKEDRTALRETCSLNKHKNCLEESFFLNEQNECCTKLHKEAEANLDSIMKFKSEDSN